MSLSSISHTILFVIIIRNGEHHAFWDNFFPVCFISLLGDIPWPTCSSDLSSWDYLWNYLKDHVFKCWLQTSCRERKNFVFWFGTQFNLTLNFTQTGWPILFSPDLSFPANKLGKLLNTLSLAWERRPVQTSHCGSRIAAAARWTHKGTYLIYGFLTRNPSWI